MFLQAVMIFCFDVLNPTRELAGPPESWREGSHTGLATHQHEHLEEVESLLTPPPWAARVGGEQMVSLEVHHAVFLGQLRRDRVIQPLGVTVV